MLRLLALEYHKFKSNSVVTTLMLLYIVLFPTVLLIGKQFTGLPPEIPNPMVFFEFPSVWDYMGYVGSWMVCSFLGFVVIYMYTSEVGNRTLRQGIINGMTRKEFYTGKLISIFALTIFATILYALTAVIMGLLHTEGVDMELIMDNNNAIIRFFFMSLGYLAFAFFVAILVRTSGLAIFLYFVYSMILDTVFKYIYGYLVGHESMNYFPVNMIEDNFPFPLLTQGEKMINNQMDIELLNSPDAALIGTIIYTLIFLGSSYYLFIKRDI